MCFVKSVLRDIITASHAKMKILRLNACYANTKTMQLLAKYNSISRAADKRQGAKLFLDNFGNSIRVKIATVKNKRQIWLFFQVFQCHVNSFFGSNRRIF